MKLTKLIASILLVLIFSTTTFSGGINFSGSIESELRYNTDIEKLKDMEVVKLVLEKDFGYNATFLFELGLESSHGNDIEAGINKLYFDYYTDNMDWRIGKQEINWGSSYKINPSSYFSPRNFDAINTIGNNERVKAVKGIYYLPDDMEFTAAVAPFVRGGTGDTEDIQYGVKLTRRYFFNYDISVSLFSGKDNLPILHPVQGELYPEVNKYGIDLIGSMLDISTWAEVVIINYNEDFYNNILEGSIGAEYKFESDVNLMGQYYFRENRVKQEPEIKTLTMKVDGPLLDFHRWDISAIYDVKGEALVIKPEFQYSLADSVWLNIGCVSIQNLNDDSESKYANMIEENIYTRISVDF
ncbi:MAG: hypothetical protein ACOC2J_00745 [bacterium]